MKMNSRIRTSRLNESAMHPGRVLCVCLFLYLCFAVKGQITEPNLLQDFENDLLLAKNPTTDPERQLWKARISIFEETEPSPNKDELKELIEKIGAVRFNQSATKPQQKPLPVSDNNANAVTSAITAAVASTVSAEPNEVTAEEPTAAVSSEIQASNGAFSEKTLKRFREMIQRPEQLKNPLELAEILFRGKCLKEAAICYQLALDRLNTADEDPYQNKAWILFQLGNSLQQDDPQAALENYRILIAECPDCPWAEAAKAKSRLVDWQMKDKPVDLVQECKL